MIVGFSDNAWDDYLFWMKNDTKVVERINILLKDIKRNPNDKHGIGKPERLKGNYSGYLLRRITSEHRLVYKIIDDLIIIAGCRYHY